MGHTSVLLYEAVTGLAVAEGDVILDATLNGGGHSEALCIRYAKLGITVIGVDLDSDAIMRARRRLAQYHCPIVYVQENFRNTDAILEKAGVSKIDKALFDLGLSSFQLDSSKRGFTFRYDEPLTMTFKKNPSENDFTARDILNTWDEETLSNIFYGYGEERFSRRIARAICTEREKSPIETTYQLVEIVVSAIPKKFRSSKIHPATKVFQSLRIAVNDEIGSMKEGIENTFNKLAPQGRIAVISFHSLEDRFVKHYFKTLELEGRATIITKKPIIPTDAEIAQNPRARSAKLRIIEKHDVLSKRQQHNNSKESN
ncbi:MAG: 16S rRNA (cytosine(1402)-N(4))-methyltransferase RsmH [Candidatus Paceibacterota bacterium]